MRGHQDTHERLVGDAEIQVSSDRSFGVVFGVVFLGYGLWPLLHGEITRWWSFVVGGTFLLLALLFPQTLSLLNRLWLKVGRLLQRVMTTVVTGLLFYTSVTPMGLLLRLYGKDLLRLRRDPNARSYWIERLPPGPTPETMRNQF